MHEDTYDAGGLGSPAANRRSSGAPNLLMRISHPVACAGQLEVVVGGYRVEWTLELGGRTRKEWIRTGRRKWRYSAGVERESGSRRS
jgi:hypothetical protein